LIEPPNFFLTRLQRQKLKTKEHKAFFKAFPIYLRWKSVPNNREKNVLFAQRVSPKLNLEYLYSNLDLMCKSNYELSEANRTNGRCIIIKFKSSLDSLLFRTMFRKVVIYIGKTPIILIFNYAYKKGK